MEPQKSIERLIKLQIKKDELLKKADDIQSVSAMGQAPPVFYATLDKAVEVGAKQAEIWNKIRGYLTPDKKITLWQLAIKNGCVVKRWGEESHLNFSMQQLEQLKSSFSLA